MGLTIRTVYVVEKKGRKWFQVKLQGKGWKAQLLIDDVTKGFSVGTEVKGIFEVLSESPYQVRLVEELEQYITEGKEYTAKDAGEFERWLGYCKEHRGIYERGFKELQDLLRKNGEPSDWKEEYELAFYEAQGRQFEVLSQELNKSPYRSHEIEEKLAKLASQLGDGYQQKLALLKRQQKEQRFYKALAAIERSPSSPDVENKFSDLLDEAKRLGHDFLKKYAETRVLYCSSYKKALYILEYLEVEVPKLPEEYIASMKEKLEERMIDVILDEIEVHIKYLSNKAVYEKARVKHIEQLISMVEPNSLDFNQTKRWNTINGDIDWVCSFLALPDIYIPDDKRLELKAKYEAKFEPRERRWYVPGNQYETVLKLLKVEMSADIDAALGYFENETLEKGVQPISADELFELFPRKWNWLKGEWVKIDNISIGRRMNETSKRKNAEIEYTQEDRDLLDDASIVVYKSGSHKNLYQHVYLKIEEKQWLKVFMGTGNWKREAIERYLEVAHYKIKE